MKSLIKNKWLPAFASLLIGAVLIQTPAYADKLYPVDEAKDSSFKGFREQLLVAIKKRDSKFILNNLTSDVLASYGGCEGVKCFSQFWKLNQPNSQLWSTLSNVLSLGGSFQTFEGKKYFCAPYVYSKFPAKVNGEELTGVHEYAAVISKDVNVRVRPSFNAPIVTTLTYDIVKLDRSFNNSSGNWLKIIAPISGYVSSKFVRNPFDYRACFQKVNGKWLMNSLVAGD